MLALNSGAPENWVRVRNNNKATPLHSPAVPAEGRVEMDRDFHGWLLEQASALRERRAVSLDWDNLAEELETMGARERREIKRQLKRLLVHLLKLRFQSEAAHRHRGWRASVRDAREEIADIVSDSPGIFRGQKSEFLKEAYKRARVAASEETRLALDSFPEQCPWSFDQVMREDFFPARRR